MPERADLLSTLPPDVRDDAQKIYDELGHTVDGPDPHAIVKELHTRGLLDDSQLREAVLALQASLKVRSRSGAPTSSAPQMLGRLGAGAMGEVLIAKDHGLNRVVAVKRLHPEGAKRKAMVRRFYKEAQVNAQLDHPGIVPIHGLVEDPAGGIAYMMKLVRGRTMEDYLQEARDQHETGRPDIEHALPARLDRFLDVCDALAYAHERGVLHRDLKPENVMVGAFGEVLVMDWGIAKLLDSGDVEEDLGELDSGGGSGDTASSAPGTKGTNANETRVGTIMGTPRYMSPEQAQGRTDILDPRSDQYALGLILFEVVSLAPVMDLSVDLEGAVDWAAKGRKMPLKHLYGKRIARELAAIIHKATAVDRDRRYPSVGAMAEDVRRYLRDEEVTAKRDNLLQRVQRWLGHHRQLALNLVFLLTLGVVGVGTLGVVGTVGTVAFLDHRAQVREREITEVMQLVVHRARDVDAELHRLEGLLHGVAFAAAHAIEAPAPNLPYDPTRQDPPGRSKGALYDRPVSVDWPRVASVESSPSRRDVEALAGLGPQLARALVESATKLPGKLDERSRHQLVAERGTPIVWARVATMDGLEASSPGTSGLLTSAPDPRKQSWFTSARGNRGVTWSGPSGDTRGQGLVLTGSAPIMDANGRAHGVVSFDVSLAHLQSLVRAPAGAEGAWLVDAQGRVVVDQGLEARSTDRYDPQPFPRADVWDAVKASANGWVYTSGGQLAVWGRVPSLDMTYVVIAPPDLLTERHASKASTFGQ